MTHNSTGRWLALGIILSTFAPVQGADGPAPFRHAYYLFELPGERKGCSDCYIPLLVTREPLEKGRPTEAAVIITYERDSVWSLGDGPVKLGVKADDTINALERKIRFEGKVYRYQAVSREEAIRLLENPQGRIPVHRPAAPITAKNDSFRKALVRDLATPAAERPVPALADVAEISLGTPTGWWLRIHPDGSAGLGFGSHGPDSTAAPARTFRFEDVHKLLAGRVRSDGNLREFFTVAFQRSGEVTTYAHYTDRADVIRALFDTARAGGRPPGSRRIEELWRATPPVPIAGAADPAGPRGASRGVLTAALVADREWRLFSEVFPALPHEGYPIRLHANGSVETRNLGGAVQWGLNAAGELELRAQQGQPLWRFHWYPERGLLVGCPERTDFPLPMVLAPGGSTHVSVTEDLRKLGVYRCPGQTAR